MTTPITHTPITALPVRVVSDLNTRPRDTGDSRGRISHVMCVQDPALGEVAVRWRIPDHPTGWIWRCTACGTRTTTADCLHTFAAGVELADRLLGLNAVAVAPHTQGATR